MEKFGESDYWRFRQGGKRSTWKQSGSINSARALLPEPDKLWQHPPLWQADVTRVRFVKSAQRLGFQPRRIAELLRLDDGAPLRGSQQQRPSTSWDVREK